MSGKATREAVEFFNSAKEFVGGGKGLSDNELREKIRREMAQEGMELNLTEVEDTIKDLKTVGGFVELTESLISGGLDLGTAILKAALQTGMLPEVENIMIVS